MLILEVLNLVFCILVIKRRKYIYKKLLVNVVCFKNY